MTTTDATPASGRTSTEDMLPGRPLIFTAAAKEVAAMTTWEVPAGTSTSYALTEASKAGESVAFAFLKPSEDLKSTEPPSVRGS